MHMLAHWLAAGERVTPRAWGAVKFRYQSATLERGVDGGDDLIDGNDAVAG
jgi:hypothetical protein